MRGEGRRRQESLQAEMLAWPVEEQGLEGGSGSRGSTRSPGSFVQADLESWSQGVP